MLRPPQAANASLRQQLDIGLAEAEKVQAGSALGHERAQLQATVKTLQATVTALRASRGEQQHRAAVAQVAAEVAALTADRDRACCGPAAKTPNCRLRDG